VKHLVIYGHPNPQSFNHAILDSLETQLKKNGHEVRVRDVYALKFEPYLTTQDISANKSGNSADDVKAEQEHVRWSDVITFIYPIWFGGPPAGLKGYMDRVFSDGFAYSGKDGLLTDKKGLTINTIAAPDKVYQDIGMYKSMDNVLNYAFFGFCGISVIAHKYYSVVLCSDEERKEMLEDIKHLADQISS